MHDFDSNGDKSRQQVQLSSRTLQSIMIFGFVMYEPIKYEDYVYPWWGNMLGWFMAGSSILCMPIMAVIQIARTKGSLPKVRHSFHVLDIWAGCWSPFNLQFELP